MFWAGDWTGQQQVTVLNILQIVWHLVCCMFAVLDRHQRIDCCGCEQRLQCCWTEEAAPWISQQLGSLVFHIACVVMGVALCWGWQCLLMVGGNLLPHIVTPLDVTTVAWCCRQNKDVAHPAECPLAALQHQSDSGQQVSYSLVLQVFVYCS
jgi:predicted DNA repair protein MutK